MKGLLDGIWHLAGERAEPEPPHRLILVEMRRSSSRAEGRREGGEERSDLTLERARGTALVAEPFSANPLAAPRKEHP
ncbi:hypothetical protein SRHO_G00214720 [Serrasalmus rhombeus]